MVTHIVLFKFKEAAIVPKGKELLLSMAGKIPQLRHLEAGVDVVRSERSYDLALVTKFDSMDGLQEYQVHPYHAGEVVPFMKANCSSVVAVDYES